MPVLNAPWRYPIKSCRGEALAAAALSPKGLPHDREGTAPWAEDGWRSLAVAEARLEAVKPCARCVIPSLDPDTGRPAHTDLLRVLNTLRPGPDGPLFGVNLAVSTVGEVAVGDEVAVQATPRTWA